MKKDATDDEAAAFMNERGIAAFQAKGDAPKIDFDALAEKAQGNERKRTQEILAVTADYPELQKNAEEAILSGKSAEEFKTFALAEIKKLQSDPNRIDIKPDSANIGMSKKEIKRFSLMNYVRSIVDKKPELAAFEREASEAVAKHLKLDAPQGIYMPHDVSMQRDQTVATATAGGNLVGTDLKAGSFIESLENELVTAQLGATILRGLVGNIAIPRKSSGATAYWLDEGDTVTESATAYDQVTLSPKTVGAMVDISRLLKLQSSPDIENLVRDDIIFRLADAIDLAALDGTGSNNQPTGLLQQSGISNGDWATANTPTWAEVVGLESTLGTANSLRGNLAYLTTPAFRGTMKTTLKDSSVAGYIMPEGNELNGYPCKVSNNMQASTLVLGNWRDLILGFWGTQDLIVDPYTGSNAGTIRLVVFQTCDIAVRHGASFAVEENSGS